MYKVISFSQGSPEASMPNFHGRQSGTSRGPSQPIQFPSSGLRAGLPDPSCSQGQPCSRLRGLTNLGFLPGFPLLVRGSVRLHPLFILFPVLFQQLTYLSLNFCLICCFVCFLVNFFPLKEFTIALLSLDIKQQSSNNSKHLYGASCVTGPRLTASHRLALNPGRPILRSSAFYTQGDRSTEG